MINFFTYYILMNKTILFLLLSIYIAITPSVSAKYYCNNLCREEAQSLLRQWHYYLDWDRDWEACERSPSCWWTSNIQSQWYYQPAQIKYSCPANSHEISGSQCECNIWYKLNTSGSVCIEDKDYTCNKKYPWTSYRATDKSCVCPDWKLTSRNAKTRSCALSQEIKSLYTQSVNDSYSSKNSVKKEDNNVWRIIFAIVGGAIWWYNVNKHKNK